MVEDSGQAGAALYSNKASETFDDVISQPDLLIELYQDVCSRHCEETAKNYADAKLVVYLLLRHTDAHGEEHRFPFLVGKEVLDIGWPDCEVINVGHAGSVAPHRKAVVKMGAYPDQIFPMLILVSNLVDGPQGIVPAGVWSLGLDEVPLSGTEFLFYSLVSRTWERFRLPGVAIDASKWEPYARTTPPVPFHQGNNGLIKRCPKSANDFHNIESKIVRGIFIAACDYVGKLTFTMDAKRVGFGLKEPIDSRFEVIELALSSFDIFT